MSEPLRVETNSDSRFHVSRQDSKSVPLQKWIIPPARKLMLKLIGHNERSSPSAHPGAEAGVEEARVHPSLGHRLRLLGHHPSAGARRHLLWDRLMARGSSSGRIDQLRLRVGRGALLLLSLLLHHLQMVMNGKLVIKEE